MSRSCRHAAIAVLTALVFSASAVWALDTQADREIRAWEQHAASDPEDGISASNLGAAYLQKARESGDFSYFKKAEIELQRCLALIPDHRAALVALATAYNSEHRFRDAIPLMRSLVASVESPAAMAALGDALLETGKTEEAGQFYEKLMKQAPIFPAFTRMASLLFLKGDNAGAIASLTQGMGLDNSGLPAENIAWCQVQLGAIYFSEGDFESAGHFYDAALKTMPGYPQALDRLAELKGAQGEFDVATKIYLGLIESTPRPDLQQALGDLYLFRGMKVEAHHWHELALAGYLKGAADGNAHWYHHLAGYYCDIQENPAEALKWARKDFELRQNIYAYDALAWALYTNAQYNDAADAITKALALGCRDSHLYFHAGMIYARAGDFAKGRDCAQQALTINPAFEKFHVHR